MEEIFPVLGEAFSIFEEMLPNLGETFPVLGEVLLVSGEIFPNLREAFPVFEETLPVFGKVLPILGETFPEMPDAKNYIRQRTFGLDSGILNYRIAGYWNYGILGSPNAEFSLKNKRKSAFNGGKAEIPREVLRNCLTKIRMIMSKKSFAEQLGNARVMLSGLQGNPELAGRRGIDVELLSKLIDSATSVNNEQEKLKADLKAKTAALDAILSDLGKEMAANRKIVKSDISKEQWKEFGIMDKK